MAIVVWRAMRVSFLWGICGPFADISFCFECVMNEGDKMRDVVVVDTTVHPFGANYGSCALCLNGEHIAYNNDPEVTRGSTDSAIKFLCK
jgi:hypothetical protein